jgi:hypothetical protein
MILVHVLGGKMRFNNTNYNHNVNSCVPSVDGQPSYGERQASQQHAFLCFQTMMRMMSGQLAWRQLAKDNL